MSYPRLWYALGAVLIGTGVAAPALAQLNPFKSSVQGLTSEDFQLMSKAAESIYRAPQVKAGNSASWQNPTTGNSGVVTFERSLRLHALPCRELAYAINNKRQGTDQHYTVNWCRTGDGSWKIALEASADDAPGAGTCCKLPTP